MSDSPERPAILAVFHQRRSSAGKLGARLAARGYRLEPCCPCRGDPLPDALEGYAGVVIFGGPQSANDDHLPGIRAELEWLERRALPSRRPLLGICLGAQEVARVLGSRIGPHPGGRVEIGYTEVHPTAAAGGFLERPTHFYQWHSETFSIPPGALHLATSAHFPGQAFGYQGRVYGIEFHPEMTLEMIERWCASQRGSAKLALPGAEPREAQIAGYARHAPDSDRWLEAFLDRWLGRG